MFSLLESVYHVGTKPSNYFTEFFCPRKIPLAHSNQSMRTISSSYARSTNNIVYTVVLPSLDLFIPTAEAFSEATQGANVFCVAHPCDRVGPGYVCQLTYQTDEDMELLSPLTTLPGSNPNHPLRAILQQVKPNSLYQVPISNGTVQCGLASAKNYRSYHFQRLAAMAGGLLQQQHIPELPL
jgi:hypothetical protein